MAADAGSRGSDAAKVWKAAAVGLCIVVALVALAYAGAPKVVAGVLLHALGPVAQLWPGAH